MTEQKTAVAKLNSIYEAMPLIMGEVRAVAKTKKNPQQGYTFRGFDDVYLACRDAMAKHGVFTTHRVREHKWEERKAKNGATLYWICVVFEVTFYAADGSSVSTDAFGEAMDTSDKAANKAMSMAMKYALVDTFLIPTDEPRDTENEHLEGTSKKSSSKQSAPEKEPAPVVADAAVGADLPTVMTFGKYAKDETPISKVPTKAIEWYLENYRQLTDEYRYAFQLELDRRLAGE